MSSQTEFYTPAAPRRIRGATVAFLLLSVAATFALIAVLEPALETLKDRQPVDTPLMVEDWHGNSASIDPAGS